MKRIFFFILFAGLGIGLISCGSSDKKDVKSIETDNLEVVEEQELPQADVSDVELLEGFDFPVLPFAFDALEPYIDASTLQVHFNKHHKGYYKKFVKALKENGLETMSFKDIFSNTSAYPDAVRNNGGGYINHLWYWENMGPEGNSQLDGELLEAINADFGSEEAFEEEFTKAAKTLFGSGWAWLILNPQGKLQVVATQNQVNPMMDVAAVKGQPLLTIDVWEHAYYLDYQNRRADFVDGFWPYINWDKVAERYQSAL